MCNACLPTPDTAHASEAFADDLLGMLNQGALALMISIGHRTGLFDTMAELPPAGVALIAEHTGLNERYVRAWLAAMVAGGIVEYAAETGHYHLPAFRAALLTRSASPDNIAVFAQYIGVLGQVEDRVVDCFRQGGGVAYEHYPRFHEVMAEDSGQTVIAGLDEHILPLVPGLQAPSNGASGYSISAAARGRPCCIWPRVTPPPASSATISPPRRWHRRASRHGRRTCATSPLSAAT